VGLVVLALQGGELVLLQADHVEQPVHAAFGLDLHVLVHFSQTRLAVVVRHLWVVAGCGRDNAGTPARARAVGLLHLAWSGDGRVVQGEVGQQAGAAAFDVVLDWRSGS
jgi:hypothetical protein